VAAVLLIFYLAVWGAAIYIYIRYLRTLQRALQRCSVKNQSLTPGLVYLQLVPGVGVGWQFVNIICVARSLEKEFRSRGVTVSRPGQTVGLVMASLQVASIVLTYAANAFTIFFASRSMARGLTPNVSGLVGTTVLMIVFLLASVILWIVYWSSIARFNRQMDATPTPESRMYPQSYPAPAYAGAGYAAGGYSAPVYAAAGYQSAGSQYAPSGAQYSAAQTSYSAEPVTRAGFYCWSCATRMDGGRFCPKCGADREAWTNHK
jgi:hypothetical protein